jgi:hypothetical protein
MMMMMMIIQFFIYLRAELNGRWPITGSARHTKTIIQQTEQNTRKENKTRKSNNNNNNNFINTRLICYYLVRIKKCKV